ncbi:MAG: cell division protein FtsL [Betaproteobacteria bacterium]|nr:cell division protein FtsL [Betaproteobacteria bacterium]
MTRLHLLMVVLLMGSCLLLVRTSYDARRLFAAIDRAKSEERALDVEFKRLDADRQAQATHLRVEKVAREKLHMRTPLPGVIVYAVDPAAEAASAAVAASSTSAASPAARGKP